MADQKHTEAVSGENKAEKADKDLTEKERADKALKEQLAKQGPSGLKVDPPKSATDELRDKGFPVQEIGVAPIPGGGPSSEPGISFGTPPPTGEEIQSGLDEQQKRLDETNKKRQEELDAWKKSERESLDQQKKAHKAASK